MANRNNVVHKGGRELYAAVPAALARDGSLSASARSVALYVWSHNEKWQQSRNDIAEALGISVHTATKALRELEARRWMVRNATERTWYLQISNTPFTEDEARKMSGQLEQKLLQSEGTGAQIAPPTRAETAPPTGAIFAPHRSTSRSAPEVHDCRSTRTHQDETGSEVRSLAVEGSEATEGVADETRPDGLVGTQPSTATGSQHDDPFASEPPWLADSRAREERAAVFQPATAATPWLSDPWA